MAKITYGSFEVALLCLFAEVPSQDRCRGGCHQKDESRKVPESSDRVRFLGGNDVFGDCARLTGGTGSRGTGG